MHDMEMGMGMDMGMGMGMDVDVDMDMVMDMGMDMDMPHLYDVGEGDEEQAELPQRRPQRVAHLGRHTHGACTRTAHAWQMHLHGACTCMAHAWRMAHAPRMHGVWYMHMHGGVCTAYAWRRAPWAAPR